MTRCVIVLLAVLALTACTASTREQTLAALEDHDQAFLEKECRLNDLFLYEPEFANLGETRFCTGEINITRLVKLSEIDSLVDYEITFKARQEQLQEWLEAYANLEARKIPSVPQQQVKALIEQIATEQRDWVYKQYIVKMILTEDGWQVEKVIR